MANPSGVQQTKNTLLKWFGPNSGTHWTIAGSVAVIMLGSYLVYSIRDGSPANAVTFSAPEQTPAPAINE